MGKNSNGTRRGATGLRLLLAFVIPQVLAGCTSDSSWSSWEVPPVTPPWTVDVVQYGSGSDLGHGISVDALGYSYVTGSTSGAMMSGGFSGRTDAYVARYSPAGLPVWIRQMGTATWDDGLDVAAVPSGGCYVTGSTYGDMEFGGAMMGNTDPFIARFDANGTPLWIRQIRTPAHDLGKSVAVDPAGGCCIAGIAGNSFTGTWTAFLAKFDANGNQVWLRQLDSAGYESATGVGIDGSGNCYITGETNGDLAGTGNLGSYDAFLAKYSPAGTQLWVVQLGTAQSDNAVDVAVDGAGACHVTGNTSGDLAGIGLVGDGDYFVAKYDAAGAPVWTFQAGKPGFARPRGVTLDASGNCIIAGKAIGDLTGTGYAGQGDIFIGKYNAAGAPIWTSQFGSARVDEGNSVAADPSGNILTTGWTRANLAGTGLAGAEDAFVAKYSGTGSRVWIRQDGAAENEGAAGIAIDSNGTPYAVGTTSGSFMGGSASGGEDVYVAWNFGSSPNFAQIGSAGNDRGLAIAANPAGGTVWITGSTDGDLGGSGNAGGDDLFIIRDSLNYWPLWTVQMGTAGNEAGLGVALDPSFNSVVVGRTTGDLGGTGNAGGTDAFVIKVDPDGTVLWTVQLGTPGDDIATAVSIDASGNIFVTGSTTGNLAGSSGLSDIFIAMYDPDGNLAWVRQVGSPGNDVGRSIAADEAGICYVTGAAAGNVFLAKYDIYGIQEWSTQLGTSGADAGTGIAVDPSGGCRVTGTTSGDLAGTGHKGLEDVFVAAYDAAGAQLWIQQFGTPWPDLAGGVGVTSDGNTFIAGSTEGDLAGTGNIAQKDGVFIKIDPTP